MVKEFLVWCMIAAIIIIIAYFTLYGILEKIYGQTPTVQVPLYQPQQAQTVAPGQTDYFAIILTAIVVPAAGIFLNKYATDKKINKNEEVQKQSMSAIIADKEAIKELARVLYQNMPQKGAEISDAPTVKLENLEKDKAEFADKAAKS